MNIGTQLLIFGVYYVALCEACTSWRLAPLVSELLIQMEGGRRRQLVSNSAHPIISISSSFGRSPSPFSLFLNWLQLPLNPWFIYDLKQPKQRQPNPDTAALRSLSVWLNGGVAHSDIWMPTWFKSLLGHVSRIFDHQINMLLGYHLVILIQNWSQIVPLC